MTTKIPAAVIIFLFLLTPSLICAQPTEPATKPAANPVEIQFVFPGSQSQGEPGSQIEPAAGREILALHTADGIKIAALFAKSTNTSGLRPTVIYFYGNGMCMADSLPIFDRFRGLGFNILMADYQGYGLSGGEPSEAGCYATADALYDYLLTRKDIDPGRIISTGWSLGGAVAIDLAHRKPVAGLATFSAFTSIPDMSRVLSERFPLAMLVKSKFDNLTKIKSITCPIFIAHGSADPLVPFAMMEKLKTAAKAKVTAVPVKDAGHNDLFEVGGDGLFNRFQVFVNQLPKGK